MGGQVFYKMSGSGNDFVMLDGRHTDPDSWDVAAVRAICDRRYGIGADGLVILTPTAPATIRMDFWNCDGSRADMCGNAALCSTRLSHYLELAPARMALETRAGTFPTRSLDGPGEMAELNLPDFQLPRVPVGLVAEPGEGGFALATVGVPHLVVEVSDLEGIDLDGRGRILRFHPALGPAGANVNFTMPAPAGGNGAGTHRVWLVRTYERGVEGETLACGTGAVATAVSLALSGQADFPVSIQTRSGRLLNITATVSDGLARGVWLQGEGRLIFSGVL